MSHGARHGIREAKAHSRRRLKRITRGFVTCDSQRRKHRSSTCRVKPSKKVLPRGLGWIEHLEKTFPVWLYVGQAGAYAGSRGGGENTAAYHSLKDVVFAEAIF